MRKRRTVDSTARKGGARPRRSDETSPAIVLGALSGGAAAALGIWAARRI